MMKIRLLAATLLLATGQLAIAEFEIVTLVRATEMSPANMILPASPSGLMTYKPCAGECDADYERARLTEATVFMIAGEAVKFEDFRSELLAIKRSDSSYALLSVDTATNIVMSIDIAK